MKTRHAIAAGLTSVTLLAGTFAATAGPAGAEETPAEHPRRAALCARIPRVEDRLTRHREHILAGADTAGSVAWLEARADRAEAEGHPRVAEQLRTRAERRAERVELIDKRLARLEKASEACTSSDAT